MSGIPKEKPVNLAALIFLVFGLLWIGVFAAGVAGVSLAESARTTCFLQGVAALLAVCVLVSRLRAAPVVVAGLAVIILIAPMIAPAASSSPSAPSVDGAKIEENAVQLALPAPMRTELGKNMAWNAHQQGYQDHPAQVKELEGARRAS